MKQRIEQLVNKYCLKVIVKDGVNCLLPSSRPNQNDLVEIKNNKDAIVDYLLSKKAEEEKAEAERNAKIDAIDGLKELEKIISEWKNYYYKLNSNYDNEYKSSILPTKPNITVEEVSAKYPRANAYLTAQSWSLANNFKKVNAGKKALDKIIDGDDYEEAIEQMKAEFDREIGENWD